MKIAKSDRPIPKIKVLAENPRARFGVQSSRYQTGAHKTQHLWSPLWVPASRPIHARPERELVTFQEALIRSRDDHEFSADQDARFHIALTDGALNINDGQHGTSLCVLPGDAPWFSARLGDEVLTEDRGFFHMHTPKRSRHEKRWSAEPVDSWERLNDAQLKLSGWMTPVTPSSDMSSSQSGQFRWSLTLTAIASLIDERALQLKVTFQNSGSEDATPPLLNRVALYMESSPTEQIFGLGAQLTWLNLKGRVVPSLVQEPGIGRGVQPLTWFMERTFGAGGSDVQSSAPSPVYLTSEGQTHALEESTYAHFDFTRPRLRVVEVWDQKITLRVFGGAPTPIGQLRSLTAFTGRMMPLPSWVHRGAIVGAQGGTERITTLWRRLRDTGAEISAFWLQDWVGKRKTSVGEQLWWDWTLDHDHYPGWELLVSDLRAKQIRTLGYINPYLVDTSEREGTTEAESASSGADLFTEARNANYLVRDPHDPETHLMVKNTSFSAAVVDLTNPDAYQWLKRVIKERLLSVGLSGWMADFGEALPMNAPIAQGDADAVHNLYPVMWARLNAEVIAEEGLTDEVLFFTRAGYLHTPRYSRLTWLGDQLASWKKPDGIYSALVGLLSSGFSGVSLTHSDAGGYISTAPPRSRIKVPLFSFIRSQELLMRWVEMNAFTAVLRTHEGNQPARHHQIDDHPDTLRHFARMTRLYQALRPLRQEREAQACAEGVPLVAHPWIFYPDDPNMLELREQFMLGPHLMVAPVIRRGTYEVTLYLPKGEWGHWWTHDIVTGPTWLTAHAPIGSPVAFYRTSTLSEEIARQFGEFTLSL